MRSKHKINQTRVNKRNPMQIDQKKKIIIIGAGIVGVIQAWYLAQSGDAQVILLEKNQAGLGVTQDSFAWLNVSYGRPDAYQYLRAQAIAEWRELDKQTQGQLNINWSGFVSVTRVFSILTGTCFGGDIGAAVGAASSTSIP